MLCDHENFWRLLERRTERIALKVEWSECLGSEMDFFHSFLLPQDRWSSEYPHPYDPDGVPFDVVDLPDGTYFAYSNNGAHEIILQAEDVFYLRWNLSRFGRMLATTLGIKPDDSEDYTGVTTFRMGNYHICGEDYPVWLILAPHHPHFQRETSRLLLNSGTPFILLTGTRKVWDGELRNQLRARNVPLLALHEMLEIRDGRFLPTTRWSESMESFRRMLFPDAVVEEPYLFASRGDWEIRFAGRKMVAAGGSTGMLYIQHLLRSPNRSIPVGSLESLVAVSTGSGRYDANSDGEATHCGYDPTLDEEARASYQQRLRELSAERERARAGEDHAEEERIDAELEAIGRELEGATNIHGHSRNLDRAEQRARDRVARNIRSAIDKIDGDIPELGRHLKNSIKSGITPCYSPAEPIAWKFD